MLELKIDDMTCGHCKGVVTNAIHRVDANLQVSVDLNAKIVRIQGDVAAEHIIAQLDLAGYSAEIVATA